MATATRIKVTKILDAGITGHRCTWLTEGKEYDVVIGGVWGANSSTGVNVLDDVDNPIFLRIPYSEGHGVMSEVVA